MPINHRPTTVSGLVHPIAPLQHGMLFHALSRPGSGVDIEQISFRLNERLRPQNFIQAWETVIERHPIMRTRLRWEGVDPPQQIVESATRLPIEVLDWSDLPSSVQLERFRAFRVKDRSRDFDLSVAPLMRLLLIRFGEKDYQGLWTFHHILLDGRSFPLVLGEIFDIYDSADSSPADPPTRRPYVDFVDYVRTQDLTNAKQFWSAYLSGFEEPNHIDVNQLEVSESDGRFGVVEVTMDEIDSARLKQFASDNQVTLNTLLQTGWALLLHHYSQKDDIVFGVTRACRYSTVEGADSMIGLLINTVPLRAQIDPSMKLSELLTHVRSQHISVRDFEATPLQDIQRWSPLASDQSLFDTLVVYDNHSLGTRMRARQGEQWVNRDFVYEGQTNYALTLLGYGDASILLRLEHDLIRFDESTASLLLAQLKTLLMGFVVEGDRSAVSIHYTQAEELRQLRAWNDSWMDYELDTCLQYLFEEQVQRTPDAVAISFEGRDFTYIELNRRANQLAHYLRSKGVDVDSRIGVCAERSLELVIAIYGIIKAGGAYAPIDPDYPADRLAFMLEDAGVAILLTQQHLLEKTPANHCDVITIDAEWDVVESQPNSNPSRLTGPKDLAYVIYTSGSTGRPKGVMIEHRSIVNRLLWMQDAFDIDSTDTVLQKTPFSFDVSVWEFFWPLLVGARLVLAKPGGHKDTTYLVKAINNYNITTLHFVPSMLQLFIEDRSVRTCSSLRRIICSGEELTKELQDLLFSKLDVELHNLYGPTEAAVDVSWWECNRYSKLGFVPIGRTITNTQLHILDPHLRPLPVGVAGELHIGGVQVARGYLNRPELSAEKFISDPSSDDPDARLYKTGDLARFMSDGNIQYLGRMDHQIKIRGLRVELGEIESVLRQHPAVKEAIVTVREDIPGDKRLVAYVASDIATTSVDSLREHLSAALAEYMIPSAFVMIDQIPLTPNGKLDRKALPAPSKPRGTMALQAPTSNVERRIIALWRDILNLEEVSTRDTFFELGGHSLLVMRLANRLSSEFGCDVAVADIFRYPTIERQAKLIQEVPGDDPALDGVVRMARQRRKIMAGRRRRIQKRVH